MQSTRTIYAVIIVVALVLVGLMLVLLNATRLTDEAFSATVDARVAILLTQQGIEPTSQANIASALTAQGIQPTAQAVQTQAAENFEGTSQANIASALTAQGIQPTAQAVQTRAAGNFESTSQANIAIALTGEGIMPKLTAAAQQFEATVDSIRATQADQPGSVLTQVADFYPSDTPTNTATSTVTNTPTGTVTSTPTPAINTDDPAVVIQALIQRGYISQRQSIGLGEVQDPKLLNVEDNSNHWSLLENSYTDFVISTTFKWGYGNREDSCGIIFRYVDSDNFYIVDASREGRVYFNELRNDNWMPRVPYETPAVKTDAEDSNQIVIVAVSDRFTIFLNGEKITETQHTTLTDSGSVGVNVGSYGSSPATACDFQNTWVWRLSQAARPTLTPSNTPTITPTRPPTNTPTVTPTELASLGATAPEAVVQALINDGVITEQQSLTQGDRRSNFGLNNTGFDNHQDMELLDGVYEDFVMGATFDWGHGAKDDTCGIIFRMIPGEVASYYLILLNRNNQVTFARQENATQQMLNTGKSADIHTGQIETNRLLLVAEGNQFALYINGKLYQTFSDDEYPAGKNAAVATTGTNSSISTCQFADAWVWKLDASQRPAPTATSTPTITPTASLTSNSPESVVQALIQAGVIDDAQSEKIGAEVASLLRPNNNGLNYQHTWETLNGVYDDFVMGTTFEWGPGAKDDSCGFIFRNRQNSDYYVIMVNREYRVGLSIVQNNDWTNLSLGSSADIETGRYATNRLVLLAEGSQFTLYINGHLYGTVTDDHHTTGQVGVLSSTGNNSDTTYCSFTDSWVWELNAARRPPVTATPLPDVVPPVVDLPVEMNTLLAGPAAGTLYHNPDNGIIEEFQPNVPVRDFVVQARVLNPYDANEHTWDFAYYIRRDENADDYHLIVTSAGTWNLYDPANELQDSGAFTGLDTTASGSNVFTLGAYGAQGVFYINGKKIAELDLSKHQKTGWVTLATGAFTGDEQPGAVTRFEDFTLWGAGTGNVGPTPTPDVLPTLTPIGSAPGLVDGDTPAAVIQALIDHQYISEKQSIVLGNQRADLQPDNSGKNESVAWQYLSGRYLDLVIGGTFTWGPGTVDDGCGVLFRAPDQQNYYLMTVNRQGQGNLIFSVMADGSRREVGQSAAPMLDTRPGGTNKIVVVVVGTQLQVFINGQLTKTFENSALTKKGEVGVAATTGSLSNDSFCHFSDAWVWWLDEAQRPLALPVSTPSIPDLATPTLAPDNPPPVVDLPVQITQVMFGPLGGTIFDDPDDNKVEEYTGARFVSDFVARVHVLNPAGVREGGTPWDFALFFRNEGGDEQYRLIIDSGKNWALFNGVNDIVKRGRLSNLDVTAGGSNTLVLAAFGDDGVFYINDEKIAELDLSERDARGSVSFITGAYSNEEVSGRSTRFEDFTVWAVRKLSGTPTPTPIATLSPDSEDPEAVIDTLIRTGVITNDQSLGLGETRDTMTLDVDSGSGTVRLDGFDDNYSDFVMSTSIEWGKGTDEDLCGVVFRIKPVGNYDALEFSRAGQVIFGTLQNNTLTDSDTTRNRQLNTFEGESNRLLVVAQGTQISVYFNGDLYKTYTDDINTDGLAGFIVERLGLSTESACTFSDAWIWKLDPKAAPATPPPATSIFIRPATATPTPNR